MIMNLEDKHVERIPNVMSCTNVWQKAHQNRLTIALYKGQHVQAHELFGWVVCLGKRVLTKADSH